MLKEAELARRIDERLAASWKASKIVPAPQADDATFIRRVFLDVIGTLPTAAEARKFLANTAPDKRAKLVDQLLESPEYAYFFANKWADILRVKRRNLPDRAYGTFAFHTWIREAIASDRPYDEFARDILGATGDETHNPPTVWFKDLQTPEQFVDDTTLLINDDTM